MRCKKEDYDKGFIINFRKVNIFKNIKNAI